MPERLDAFPRKAKPNALFDGLTDGSVWRVTVEESGYASANSLGAVARYYAKSRKLAVKAAIVDGALIVQFGERATPRNELAAQRVVKRQARLAGQA